MASASYFPPRISRPRHSSSPVAPRPQGFSSTRSTPNLPSSLQALDLHPRGGKATLSALASVRIHVLSYLSDLETRLALVDFISNAKREDGDYKIALNQLGSADQKSSTIVEDDEQDSQPDDMDLSVEDVAAFVEHGVELLRRIRADVCSYLPDVDFDFDFDLSSGSPGGLRSRITEFDVRSKLPDMPSFDFDMRMPTMDSLRSQISEIAPASPSSYIPTLQTHLSSLQAHMQGLDFSVPSALPIGISPPKVLSDLLTSLLEEDTEEAIEHDIQKAKEEEGTMREQVKQALEKSGHGSRLIDFDDLPSKWQNNENIRTGYRFIPASRWPTLLASVFRLHNETLNIHTHLLPALSLLSLVLPIVQAYLPTPLASFFQPTFSTVSRFVPLLLPDDPTIDPLPAIMFKISAACCLLSSVTWHVFSGCSDDLVVERAARGDYVGIGWLISASVSSVVYYGFNCQTTHLRLYMSLCILTGFAGSVVPFQSWFNERRHKKWRIVFFLVLAFTSLLPLAHLSIDKGLWATVMFILPVMPSLACYLSGLTLYATHFPECFLPIRSCWGVSSHSMWHMFIIVAIRAHWVAMGYLKLESTVFSCAA